MELWVWLPLCSQGDHGGNISQESFLGWGRSLGLHDHPKALLRQVQTPALGRVLVSEGKLESGKIHPHWPRSGQLCWKEKSSVVQQHMGPWQENGLDSSSWLLLLNHVQVVPVCSGKSCLFKRLSCLKYLFEVFCCCCWGLSPYSQIPFPFYPCKLKKGYLGSVLYSGIKTSAKEDLFSLRIIDLEGVNALQLKDTLCISFAHLATIVTKSSQCELLPCQRAVACYFSTRKMLKEGLLLKAPSVVL